MPFKSESQKRFMYSKHPKIAKEFNKKTRKKKLSKKIKTAKKALNKELY